MDPLSLLSRLAAPVPPPRLHTVRYAGALASASSLRSRIAPKPPTPAAHGRSRDLRALGESTEMPVRSPAVLAESRSRRTSEEAAE
jgi:hypothetical protein